MGFASTYIEQRILFPPFINEAPDNNTGIITVVPSYGEDNIIRLLNSLATATGPDCGVEVIVVINAPENASPESLEKNRNTLNDIESWKQQKPNCWFRLFSIDVKPGAIPRHQTTIRGLSGSYQSIPQALCQSRPCPFSDRKWDTFVWLR